MEDQEKTQPEGEDVEAHKKRGGAERLAGEEESQGESSDEDFELHRKKGPERL